MIFRLGLRADIINVVFLSLLLLASSRTFSFPLFLFSCYVFFLPQQCKQAHFFSEGKTLYKNTAISTYWANTSMGQSSNRTQVMFWPPLFFYCFGTLGTHLLYLRGVRQLPEPAFPFSHSMSPTFPLPPLLFHALSFLSPSSSWPE